MSVRPEDACDDLISLLKDLADRVEQLEDDLGSRPHHGDDAFSMIQELDGKIESVKDELENDIQHAERELRNEIELNAS